MSFIVRNLVSLLSVAILAIPMPVNAQNGNSVGLRTVVIDPGHGGKDPGCVSRDGRTYEKNIVLDVAKRLSEKIAAEYPDMRVLMTRDDDTFVELEGRAVAANSAGGQLFISIHVNATDRGTTANGFSIHCLGQSRRQGNDLFSKNLALVQRENSVITMEDNYQTRYQGFNPNDPQSYIIFNLMQNAHLANSLQFAEDLAGEMANGPVRHSRGVSQDPFWVLWRTAMPAVLIEVGFITNPDDLSVMRSDLGRDGIASNIFNAFKKFKTRYDASMGADAAPAPDRNAAVAPSDGTAAPSGDTASSGGEAAPATAASVLYGTQVLASGRTMAGSDPYFKGYLPTVVRIGTLNKYIIGISPSLDEARRLNAEIREKFPDSFLVKIEEGSVSAVR